MSDVHSSVASYLLGALPPNELDEFERHLAGCAACRAELDELAPAIGALATSVPAHEAPPELRARVLSEVRREADVLRAAGPEADRPRRRKPRRRWAFVPAVAATLAVGFGAGLLVAGDGGERTVPFQGSGSAADARAEIELDGGHATLVANRLPAPPEGSVYQVWIKHRGQDPQPTDVLFTPRTDGSALVAIPGEAADAELVIVNSEPPGGSDAPTTAPLLTARMD